MTAPREVQPPVEVESRRDGFKIWQLCLLIGFVALAIVDIQDHRITDPALVGIASGGFAAYAGLAWLGWRFARRFERKLGRVTLLGLYLAAMTVLFLVATISYLEIEDVFIRHRAYFRGGWF